MRGLKFSTAALLLFSAVAPGALPAVEPQPVIHQEFQHSFEELSNQLQGLGAEWFGHFQGRIDGERPLITFMLRHRDDLRLSDSQVKDLERLRTDFEREAIRKEADIRIAEMDLSRLLENDPVDIGRAEAKVREIEKLRADLRVSRIRTIEAGMARLNDEQRARLRKELGGQKFSSQNKKSSRQPEGKEL